MMNRSLRHAIHDHESESPRPRADSWVAVLYDFPAYFDRSCPMTRTRLRPVQHVIDALAESLRHATAIPEPRRTDCSINDRGVTRIGILWVLAIVILMEVVTAHIPMLT